MVLDSSYLGGEQWLHAVEVDLIRKPVRCGSCHDREGFKAGIIVIGVELGLRDDREVDCQGILWDIMKDLKAAMY